RSTRHCGSEIPSVARNGRKGLISASRARSIDIVTERDQVCIFVPDSKTRFWHVWTCEYFAVSAAFGMALLCCSVSNAMNSGRRSVTEPKISVLAHEQLNAAQSTS